MKNHSDLTHWDEESWNYQNPDLAQEYDAFLAMQDVAGSYVVGDLRFDCPAGIYHPTDSSSTRLTWRALFDNPAMWGQRVLDIGCGCGVLGISMASTGREVTLVDINPAAIAATRHNLALNSLQANVQVSDLFTAIHGQTFDLILFNVPLMDRAHENPHEAMLCDPDGALFSRFLREAPHYLSPHGAICTMVANIGNRAAILDALQAYHNRILRAEYKGDTNEWRWVLKLELK